MSLTSKRFYVLPDCVEEGERLGARLENGSMVVLAVRKSPHFMLWLVLADPWMPCAVVERTEHLACVMLRARPDYRYGFTRLKRDEIRDLATSIREDSVVLEGVGRIGISTGAWLSATISLNPDYEYPPRTELVWRAPSRVAGVQFLDR